MLCRDPIVRLLCLALVVPASALLLSSAAQAGAKVVERDDFSMILGMRMQPRVELEQTSASGGTSQWQRDFLLRRVRITAAGKMRNADYKLEWKIDSTDRINGNPSAQVENAYIQWPLGAGLELRVGLYDQPFSRDRLTSDSKQLAVDRGAVSNVPDALGLADNAVGFHLTGEAAGGRAEYAVGLFDNRKLPGEFQDLPMLVARLDLNFGATGDVFQDAHFGDDSWYSVGINGSYQGAIEDSAGVDDGSNAAFGLDGMIDVPTGSGRLFARAEVNGIRTEEPGSGDAVYTTVWMGGLGYLIFDQRLQPFVRYDHVRPDEEIGAETRNITHVGANFYQSGHNLKIQGDVRFEADSGYSVDGMRIQAQVYF